MARLPTITEESFQLAVDALQAANKSVTQTSVREELGGGSYTTVNKLLKEWKIKQQTAVQLPPTPTMPEAVQQALLQVWVTATSIAAAEVVTVRKDAQERIAESEADRNSAMIEVERLEGESVKQEQQIDFLTKDTSKLSEQVTALGAVNESLKAELVETRSALGQLQMELGRAQERTRHLESQLNSMEVKK